MTIVQWMVAANYDLQNAKVNDCGDNSQDRTDRIQVSLWWLFHYRRSTNWWYLKPDVFDNLSKTS